MINSMADKDNVKSDLGLTLTVDRPIAGKSEDRLGRGPFASRLAAAIAKWNGDDGLVIGLYGSWGSGKSSVKNLVIEELSVLGSDAPDILEFNPWQWRGHDNVSAAFFREVLRKLGGVHTSEDRGKTAKKLRRYAKFLSIGGVLFEGIPVAVGVLIGIIGLIGLTLPTVLTSGVAASVGQALSIAIVGIAVILIWGEKLLERIAAWFDAQFEAGVHSLEEQKQIVASALRQYPNSLLVVIDDIDRLTKSEIRAVFQLVKANADFPHFIYLMLFQRDIVERALENKVSGKGAKFLEKIVQVGFELPLVRQDEVEKILFEGLNALLGKDVEKLDVTYWGNMYQGGLRQYFSNLREVKRFLGVFGFHLGLLRSENILDVNPVDLIALETLSLFEPSLYTALPASKALLTGRSVNNSLNRADLLEDCQSILNLSAENHRDGLKELLKELFPPVADAFGGSQHDSDSYQRWLSELRVCSPEIFNRYFERSLAPLDISQSEVHRLVGLASDGMALTKELKRYATDGRLMIAIERFGAAIEASLDPSNIADVLIALFNIGEDLPDKEPGFFSQPPDWTVLRLITKILQLEKDVQKREQALERAIKETDCLSVAVTRIGRESSAEVRSKHPESLVILDTSVKRFQQQCAEKIRVAASAGKLHTQRELAHILYRWKDWGGDEEVRAWVGKLTASKEGAISFLTSFLYSSATQDVGDKVVKIKWYIKYSDIENFADLGKIETALKDVSLTSLPEKNRMAVEEFRKALKRKRDGKAEDVFGWDSDDN